MNPRIPASYAELARWLWNFATSHAKQECAAVEAVVESGDGREGRSYGLRLVLGSRTAPPAELPPIELSYSEVAAGRPRLAWCEGLAARIHEEAHRLADDRLESRSA